MTEIEATLRLIRTVETPSTFSRDYIQQTTPQPQRRAKQITKARGVIRTCRDISRKEWLSTPISDTATLAALVRGSRPEGVAL